MDTIEVLLDLAAIAEKQIKDEDNRTYDMVERLSRKCAKSELLTEIYRKIKEVRENG